MTFSVSFKTRLSGARLEYAVEPGAEDVLAAIVGGIVDVPALESILLVLRGDRAAGDLSKDLGSDAAGVKG